MTVLQGEASIAPPRQTARQVLRESTHAAHQRLEDLVEAGGYFETQAGYLNWLDRMLAVHTEYLLPTTQGARLCGLLPNGQTLIAALRSDLGRTMNMPVIEPEMAGHPADALGALYVFEGSALGGKLLLRRLDGLAGVPQRYLTLLTEHSRTRWPAVLATLETKLSGDKADLNRATDAALGVFTTLYSSFSKPS